MCRVRGGVRRGVHGGGVRRGCMEGYLWFFIVKKIYVNFFRQNG